MSTATELEPCVVVQRIGPIDHDGRGSVSAPGEGHCHPDAFTAVDNLFLGASYVRTGSDIHLQREGGRYARGAGRAYRKQFAIPRAQDLRTLFSAKTNQMALAPR